MDELTINARPARRTYRFGPGSHESLTMTTWTTKHGIGRVRLRGTYSVFCGTGGEHSVRIDETATTVDLVTADSIDYALAVEARTGKLVAVAI